MAAPKGVYKIESKKNGRAYIGSSDNITRRWNHHISELKRNKHHSIILQNHTNKYGLDDLTFSIIIECNVDDLIKYEQKYIDMYNPYFNVRKIADSNRGIKRSKETKERLRRVNIGKKLSEKTRMKMSKRMIGNSYTKGMIPVNARKVICTKTGIIFNKIGAAAEHIGMKRSTLNAQLLGQNKNRTTLKYL